MEQGQGTRKMCGGVGELLDVTEEVKSFCNEVKEDVLKNLGLNAVEQFQPLKYKSQLVAGTNYFVKVQISGAGECVHIRFHEPLPCYKQGDKNVEFTSAQGQKQIADEIEHF